MENEKHEQEDNRTYWQKTIYVPAEQMKDKHLQ